MKQFISLNSKLMKKILLILTLVVSKGLFAQKTVSHHCDFASGKQNMWGPSFSAFTMNQTIDIFSYPWNTSGGTGNGGIVTILGQSFGAAASFGTSGVIGSDFTLAGFTTGEVEVDYPVNITLNMPNDNTYDQGDLVSINSSYTVDTDYALETYYPNAGSASLDMYFQFAANADLTVCAFGCVTIPIIPSFSSPMMRLNIFRVEQDEVWYLGPACAEAIPYYSANTDPDEVGEPSPGQNIFPFALPPAEDGCTAIPWQVHEDIMPLEIPDNDFGISGELTVPDVTTDDYLASNNVDLYATGDLTYAQLQLEVFKLIGGVLGVIDPAPPPIEIASQILSNLSGEFELPAPFGTIYGATMEYNIMSASFNVYVTNVQRFDFKPKIYGKYEFPVPVNYAVYNGATQTSTGTGSIINFEIGNRVDYYYPCYFSDVEIKPTYNIVGQFTNHTYDSISFTFEFSALSFGFELPPIQITPEIHVPEICIPIPYPCPSWSNPFRWCTEWVCTPEFTIPAVGFDGFSFSVGPLIDETLPIGDVSYDWFNQTWQLGGFTECTHPGFHMVARQFSATQTHTNVLCYGGNNGSIDVSTVNGTAPFTYAWSNGPITQDLNTLSANNYQVIITDANGCRTSTGATITQPSQPLQLSAIVGDKLCNGGINTGTIDVLTQGGTAPYGFSWSSGQNTEDLTGLNTGSYTLTVTDFNGCTANITRTITQPTVVGQSGIIDDVNCRFGADGNVNVTPFGGVQPYSYSWSNGQTGEDLSNVVAGTYNLTVTDFNGCISTVPYTIAQPATLPSVNLTQSSVSCHGGANGGISNAVAGGTPGYTFVWSDGNNFQLPYGSQNLTNIPAGTYGLTMTDANGCSVSSSVTVTQPTASIDDNPVLTHINCFGNATGAITSGITGGTAPYTYAWSNGATTADLSNVAAGTYTLQVTDFRGCTSNYSYTLTQPNAALAIVLTPNTVGCFGESTGEVLSSVTGGTTPYSYAWSNAATTPSITGVVAGTYGLTVTDNKGCVANNSATITQPAAPLSIGNTTVAVSCHNGSNGSIDLTVNGGTTPYTYEWWDETNQILTTTTQDLSNLPSSTYVVEVHDNRGCVIMDTAIITQPAAAIAITGVMDDVNCYAGSDGGLNATVTGGTFPYTFSWSNTAVTEDLVNVTAGNYTLTVTDINGCIEDASFDITQPISALSSTLNPTAVICNGGTTGSIQSFVSGGTAPYTYSWSNGATTSSLDQIPAGPYSLTVTDSKGCFAFTGTMVNQPSNPLNAVPTITDASCYNYSDGEVVLNISGGTAPYTFSWANNNQIVLNNPSETISELSANDYLVRIYDRNNCLWQQVITVGQPMPFLTTLQPTNTLCNGGSDGSISMSVIGGTLPYSVLWSDGQTTTNATGLQQGFYSVTVTDDQGCIVRDTVTVGQPLPIYLVVDAEELSCIDQQDASISVLAAGGIQPYTYSWSNGGVANNINDLVAGTYVLTITDDHGCVKVETITIDPVDNGCINPVNTFTPNGDNYNDTWVIENLDLYPNAKVQVFNKWGNLVHSQQGVYDPWDGTYGDKLLPSEVYYYIIDLYNNEENKYTGSITIIR